MLGPEHPDTMASHATLAWLADHDPSKREANTRRHASRYVYSAPCKAQGDQSSLVCACHRASPPTVLQLPPRDLIRDMHAGRCCCARVPYFY
jgi:hypothetical protein